MTIFRHRFWISCNVFIFYRNRFLSPSANEFRYRFSKNSKEMIKFYFRILKTFIVKCCEIWFLWRNMVLCSIPFLLCSHFLDLYLTFHFSPAPPNRPPQFSVGGPNMGTSKDGEEDDTMKNLRKTFAGIFGDMWSHLAGIFADMSWSTNYMEFGQHVKWWDVQTIDTVVLLTESDEEYKASCSVINHAVLMCTC